MTIYVDLRLALFKVVKLTEKEQNADNKCFLSANMHPFYLRIAPESKDCLSNLLYVLILTITAVSAGAMAMDLRCCAAAGTIKFTTLWSSASPLAISQ